LFGVRDRDEKEGPECERHGANSEEEKVFANIVTKKEVRDGCEEDGAQAKGCEWESCRCAAVEGPVECSCSMSGLVRVMPEIMKLTCLDRSLES
jgi:hypothetical protein